MHILGLFVFSFLLPIACSVHIEEAFVKDWVRRFHSPLIKYDIISDEHLIGFTSDNKFILTDPIKGNNIIWSIDLKKLPSTPDNYQLSPDFEYAYLYSNSSNQIFAYETRSGLLVDSYNIPANIRDINKYFGNGLLLLDSFGNLYSLSNGTIASISIDENIDQFSFTQSDGRGYIFYNKENILEINYESDVLGKATFNEDNVVHFENGIIATDDQIFKLAYHDQLSIDFISNSKSFEGIEIIDDEYLLSYNKTDLCIFHIGSSGLTLLKRELFNKEITTVKLLKKSLNTVVIVTYNSSAGKSYDAILNLTDFLSDQNNVIATFRIESSKSKYFITFNDELYITSLSQTPEEITISRLNVNSGGHDITRFDIFSTNSSSYILIDKPISQKTITKVHHLLDNSNGTFISRWMKRLYRHLGNIGEYATSFIVELDAQVNTFNEEDTFGFEKLIIFFDELRKRLVAVNSIDGSLFWKSPSFDFSSPIIEIFEVNDTILVISEFKIQAVNSRTGELTEEVTTFSDKITKAIRTKDSNMSDTLLLCLSSGKYVTYNDKFLNENQVFLESNKNEVSGVKIEFGEGIKTWKFSKVGEEIIHVASKSKDSTTQSIGIALADKSVLYKYLYPNIVTIFTRCNDNLKAYLLDGVTGSLLHNFEHSSDELINFDSINIVMDDNWIIYSYFVQSPKIEQRINVIDLFDTTKAIGSGNTSSLNHNITIDSIHSKSYIFPERILSLSSSQTAFGITLKSIFVATETGKLYEIQKSVLSGRRIDNRELTPEDFQNDFRMIPYDPVIGLFTYEILNHKHQLLIDTSGKILTKPTNLESTLVICYANKDNLFCTSISPSLSYDSLGHKFNKSKLLLTIVGIFIGYIISIPLVGNKRLNSKWIDRP